MAFSATCLECNPEQWKLSKKPRYGNNGTVLRNYFYTMIILSRYEGLAIELVWLKPKDSVMSLFICKQSYLFATSRNLEGWRKNYQNIGKVDTS